MALGTLLASGPPSNRLAPLERAIVFSRGAFQIKFGSHMNLGLEYVTSVFGYQDVIKHHGLFGEFLFLLESTRVRIVKQIIAALHLSGRQILVCSFVGQVKRLGDIHQLLHENWAKSFWQ